MSSTNRGTERSGSDYYPTPSWCVDRLLDVLDLPNGRWLEPCAGDGAIIRAVSRRQTTGIAWTAVELQESLAGKLPGIPSVETAMHADYFDVASTLPRCDVMFTNPPFSLAMDFIEAGLERADHVVALLRLNFLASRKRAPLMRRQTPDVYVLPDRPSFTGRGTDSIEYAWFHWTGAPADAGRLRVLGTTPATVRRSASHRPASVPEIAT